MKGDLYINGFDAWTTWGVNMGDGFLDAIDGFAPLKDYIQNESRIENGKRVTLVPKVASREFSLKFTIRGETQEDYRTKRTAFEDELRTGYVTINVPALGQQNYHLIYLGKSVNYAMNISRTFSTVAAKFEEPNPANRV